MPAKTKFSSLYLVMLGEKQEYICAHSVQDVQDYVKRKWASLEVTKIERISPIVYGTEAAIAWMADNAAGR